MPWFHNCVLLDKVKSAEERLFYVQQATENGWSRSILVIQIESELYLGGGMQLPDGSDADDEATNGSRGSEDGPKE